MPCPSDSPRESFHLAPGRIFSGRHADETGQGIRRIYSAGKGKLGRGSVAAWPAFAGRLCTGRLKRSKLFDRADENDNKINQKISVGFESPTCRLSDWTLPYLINGFSVNIRYLASKEANATCRFGKRNLL
jgi:hypothetical protein